jgi:hypothetical protein
LKTIRYIEDNIMNKPFLITSNISNIDHSKNNNNNKTLTTTIATKLDDSENALTVYLFIWDRYRMIAKDFILQKSSLELSELCIECHERMARWFVLMDHKMRFDGFFCIILYIFFLIFYELSIL